MTLKERATLRSESQGLGEDTEEKLSEGVFCVSFKKYNYSISKYVIAS